MLFPNQTTSLTENFQILANIYDSIIFLEAVFPSWNPAHPRLNLREETTTYHKNHFTEAMKKVQSCLKYFKL